jgi:putative phage-type endonuclease
VNIQDTDIAQGSEPWFQMKCGFIGASRISDIMSNGKNGAESTGRANYRAQLVCERLTGCVTDSFGNAYTQRGTEDEGAARECYSFVTGYEVEQTSFLFHPALPFAGCSPDGLIGTDGLVEIKRKIPAIHIDYIFKNRVPPEYTKQMLWQLAVTGRQWNDFCSYCPELPENMQLFTCRMYRDEVAISAMESAVIAFQESVEQMISDLKRIRG